MDEKTTGAARKPDTGWYTNAVVTSKNAPEFVISTAQELAGLAAIVNGTWGGKPKRDDFHGKTVKLAGDIDLAAYDNWKPIGRYGGNSGSVFSGTFDGRRYTISNLAINRPDADYQGLFGYIVCGRVINLRLAGANISGRGFVGGVAGGIANCSSVNYCCFTGAVTGSGSYVGGLTGWVYMESSVINSCSAGAVSADSAAGGVAGVVYKRSNVSGCYSVCAVCGTGDYVGGIVGGVDKGSVVSCAALNPEVTGGVAEKVGRIAGNVEYDGTLSNNIANAEMRNSAGGTEWPEKGVAKRDGKDISAARIAAGGKIGGGLFADRAVWAAKPGKLPGLFGKAAVMPEYLQAAAEKRGGSRNPIIALFGKKNPG